MAAAIHGARLMPDICAATHESESGPVLPKFGVQQVGGCLGYTGCGANPSGRAAGDPQRSWGDGHHLCSMALNRIAGEGWV